MPRSRSPSVLIAALWLGLMGDCATTELGMRRHGPAYEVNPIGRFLLRRIGTPGVATLLTGLCFSLHRSLRVIEPARPRAFRKLLRLIGLITAVRYAVVVANARSLGPSHPES